MTQPYSTNAQARGKLDPQAGMGPCRYWNEAINKALNIFGSFQKKTIRL
jgi:hypothetical protein